MHELSCHVRRYTRYQSLHKLGKHVLAELTEDPGCKVSRT